MDPKENDKRVKIVCTLGPSSQTASVLMEMVRAGMDVARLNFSHGDHAFHQNLVQTVRSVSKQSYKPVAILQDLQGPKLRVGKLADEGILLEVGDEVVLFPEGSRPKISPHGKKELPLSAEIAEAVAKDVQKGHRILFDDGKVSTRIIRVEGCDIVVEVEVGGLITSRKGMNLPQTPLSLPCLTEKDLIDLKFGLEQGVDAIALSFVRSAQDIENVRDKIRKNSNLKPLIFAKIEREEAVRDQESIIDVSDGLLIARGDMAVELGVENVPLIQKQLIQACNDLGVPIITATQMLESMIHSATPTRAEASDVANAVFDGTDAVMLSAETASGDYPVETVRTMSKIVLRARSAEHYSRNKTPLPVPGSTVDSIEFSASRIADHVGASLIACITHSGMAAKTISKFRPHRPVVAIMDHEPSLRKLCFHWGVRGALIEKILQTDDIFAMVEHVLKEQGWVQDEDIVVITAGIPTLRRGTTNTVKVHRIGSSGAHVERSLKDLRS